MRLGTPQRHIDVEHVLRAGAVIRCTGLWRLIGLAVLNAADDRIVQPHGDFLDRLVRHGPPADQQVVAVVDVAGADRGIDIDPDSRRLGGCLATAPPTATGGIVASDGGWSASGRNRRSARRAARGCLGRNANYVPPFVTATAPACVPPYLVHYGNDPTGTPTRRPYGISAGRPPQAPTAHKADAPRDSHPRRNAARPERDDALADALRDVGILCKIPSFVDRHRERRRPSK